MKKTLDLRGLTCPEPVLRTKKLIDDATITCIEALVDSEVNVQNLSRLAGSQNLSVVKEKAADYFRVVLERQKNGASEHTHAAVKTAAALKADINTAKSTGTVIFISRNTFGDSAEKDHDFSANLLNLFLQTISQSGHKPRAILMVNSGVKLVAPDGPYIKVLNDLKDMGTEVFACGLCLDYYGLKESVPLEQITNMFAICEYLFSADKIISP